MPKEQNTQFETLRTVSQQLFEVHQQLAGVIHPNILSKIENLKELVQKEIEPTLKKENDDWDKNYEVLNKIAEENKLSSVWSISKIKAHELNKKTPEIQEIVYSSWGPDQVHTFDKPKKITWLELWKIADKMIKASQDTHHIYIESLEQDKNKPGKFRLSTGS
jgi:dsDNA-specific endonuclease/ATPase MutS2